MKAIDNALSDSDKDFVTPVSILDSLMKQCKEQLIDKEFASHCLELIRKYSAQ